MLMDLLLEIFFEPRHSIYTVFRYPSTFRLSFVYVADDGHLETRQIFLGFYYVKATKSRGMRKSWKFH